jgi:hypothetical protein
MVTITNTMAEITWELDDREIYNDIRSQTEVTETTTTTSTDAPAEYGQGQSTSLYIGGLAPGASAGGVVYAPGQRTDIVWTGTAFANGFYIPAGGGGEIIVGITCVVTSTSGLSANIMVTNNSSYSLAHIGAGARYTYLSSGPVTSTDTQSQVVTYTVSKSDSASINKYGRRSMDLNWPLGQTKAQVTSLVNSYLTRYKEPIPRVSIRLLGANDTNIGLILSLKISDRITVVNTELGMSADFFINSVNFYHDFQGDNIPVGEYTLEMVRGTEEAAPWILDTSELDTETILG